MEVREWGYISIKLYLKQQVAGQARTVGLGFLTPGLVCRVGIIMVLIPAVDLKTERERENVQVSYLV